MKWNYNGAHASIGTYLFSVSRMAYDGKYALTVRHWDNRKGYTDIESKIFDTFAEAQEYANKWASNKEVTP